MMLQIQETYINADKHAMIGESDWYEPYTGDDKGRLYRAMVKEYGRCTGRVYIDVTADGKAGTLPVGWVFLKRVAYEDAHHGETYLREVWVEYRHVEDEAVTA